MNLIKRYAMEIAESETPDCDCSYCKRVRKGLHDILDEVEKLVLAKHVPLYEKDIKAAFEEVRR